MTLSKSGWLWPPAFRALMLIGIANGLTRTVVNSLTSESFWTALESTFGVSTITIGAVVAGWTLASRMSPRQLDLHDGILLTVYTLILILPFETTSMAAVFMLSVYAAFRDRHDICTVAAASVFGAIGFVGASLALPLRLFGPPFLALDAHLAAPLLQTIHPDAVAAGNLIETQTGQPLVVGTGCASVAVVLQALLCWLAIVRVFRPAWSLRDLAALPALVAGMIAINVTRIAAMGITASSYRLIHGPMGTYAISLACIFLAVAASRWTLRRPPGTSPATADRRTAHLHHSSP